MKKSLLLLCLLLTSLGCIAQDFSVDGIYYKITSSTAPLTVAVTYLGSYSYSYSSEYTGSVTIPESVTYSGNTYSVTSIGSDAFSGRSGLTSVTIGNSVTSIGDLAFAYCSGLTSVTIPESVTSIGGQAFSGCSGLTSITIGNSVTSIGSDAFYGTAWYNNQPDGLIYAGKVAYKYKGTMPAGTEIILRDGTLVVADYAFYGCSGLTSVTIPECVTSIGERAFFDCSRLTSVTIPNSVTSIGEDAFVECSGLTSVTIGSGVTSIGRNAFQNCSRLTSITINSNTIASKSYNSSSTLANIFGSQVTEYVFGNNVQTIGQYACYKCPNLTSVTIPESVTSIESDAFSGCSGLTKAEFASIEHYLNGINFSVFGTSNPLYYAHHLYIEGSEVTDLVIPEGVTSIRGAAFQNCSGLTSITIPESVTSIGRDAFEGTAWYNNQPDGLIYAGKVAYKYKGTMPAGTEIILRDGTLVVADYAFYGCSGLTSVTIPECVTSIGDYAFDCSNLTTVIVKWRTPLAISSNAFSNRMNATLGIPQGTLTAYKLATYWQDFKEFIEIGTPISSITLNKEALILYNIGECEQLIVTVEPSNAGNTNMTWRSYNESVCTVTNGLVQATGYGMTVVTATADDGIHMAVCTVTVKQGIPGDLNRDGKLGLIDLQILTQILVGREKNYNFYNADVNEDGRLSLADLTRLVNLLQ